MYMYNADLYCDDCGAKLVEDCDARGDEDTGDSDDYPQEVSHLSDEADSPTHCGTCGTFLENDLTDEGRDYVLEVCVEAYRAGNLESVALTIWLPYYFDADVNAGASDAFDRARGAYWAAADYHGGQASRGYALLSRLSLSYRPGACECSRRLRDGAAASYVRTAAAILKAQGR